MARERWLTLAIWLALPVSGVAGEPAPLPPTVVYEAVVPDVPFFTTPSSRLESELVLVNSQPDPVLLELELFHDDGSSPAELFNSRGPGSSGFAASWRSTNALIFSADNGRFYREIDAHSVAEISLPGEQNALSEGAFSGWARLRANRPIAVYQRTRLRGAGGQVVSRFERTASLGQTPAGVVKVASFRSAIHGSPSGELVAYLLYRSGVVLVNPNEEPITLRLELENVAETITLGARARRADSSTSSPPPSRPRRGLFAAT